MTTRGKQWTANEVKARLSGLDLSEIRKSTESAVTGYHLAASVRSIFDPDTLDPIGEPSDADFKQLLRDSTVVSKPDGGSAWALRPKAREQSLRLLAEWGKLGEVVVHSQRTSGTDSFQEMFGLYLQKKAPSLRQQTLDQLTSSQEVTRLLNEDGIREFLPADVLATLPDEEELPERIALERLLKPLRDLAGRHFRGREKELVTLRDYVEFFGASSMFQSARRTAREIFNLNEKPPLLVTGPGGIGKSTLIAKFILDHLDAALGIDGEETLLFSYLDLDRPDLAADKPVSLLVGILEQMGTVVPRIREGCDELAASAIRDTMESAVPNNLLKRFVKLVQEATGGMNAPVFLLVFDNFEEVQYRSLEDVEQLWKFLNQLQGHIPKLRTVLAGRSRVSGFATQTVELDDFGKEAAEGYLAARGITDAAVGKEIVDRVGGNPLSLRLAVELVRKEGISTIKDVNLRRFFLFKLSNVLIQGQLYHRILEHLHNPEVRKLAHPGLVLRRITPEVILQVLAGPCDVKVDGIKGAKALFLELKRESSLVKDTPSSDADQVLELRSDVRRMMLQQLVVDEPVKVRSIHESAVAFYSQYDDVISRAEEIYHRLALGQTDDRVALRFVKGVEQRLRNAVQEMPRASQPFLASRVGVEIDAELWREADLESWEIQAAARIERLLASNRDADAMKVLSERKERSSRSPLFRVEALVYERAAGVASVAQRAEFLLQARNAISRSLPSWTTEDVRDDLLLEKLVIAARLDVSVGTAAAPGDLVDEFQSAWRLNPGDPRVLRLGLHRLKLLESMGGSANEASYILQSEVIRCAATLIPERLSLDNRVLFDFGVEFAASAPEAVLELVRRFGIGRMFPTDQLDELRRSAERSVPSLSVGGGTLQFLATATGSRFPAWADLLVLQILRRIKGPETEMPVLSSSSLAIQTEPMVTQPRLGMPLVVDLGVFGEGSIMDVSDATREIS